MHCFKQWRHFSKSLAGVPVYVTYCFCSSNNFLKIQFTKKSNIISPWGSVDRPDRHNDSPHLKLIQVNIIANSCDLSTYFGRIYESEYHEYTNGKNCNAVD